MVKPRHQTPQGQSVAKPETPLQNIPSWVARCNIKGSDVDSDLLIEGPGTKTSWEVRDCWTPSITELVMCHVLRISVDRYHCQVLEYSWIFCTREFDYTVTLLGTIWEKMPLRRYSISQEICIRFCCALLCCGYAIVHNEFTWIFYPYSSGLLCWHWGNR